MSHNPLELSPEAMRQWGNAALEMVIRHRQTLPNKAVLTLPDKSAVRARLRRPIPQAPQAWDAIWQALGQDIFQNMAHTDHPRFFPYVPGPGNFIGALAAFLAAGFNTFSGTWLEAAGPTEVELATLDWLKGFFGWPATARGAFVSGGSTANWTALAAAREHFLRDDSDDLPSLRDWRRGEQMRRLTVYYSDQTHHSVDRSLRLLGFLDSQLRRIPSTDRYQIDLGALREAIDQDRAAGYRPAIVVGNAGTTNTAAIDPLSSLADIRDAEGMWLHVDAAYGGAAALCEELRPLLNGVQRADSLTIDPHKWLFQPYEMGCVLARDGESLRRAFHDAAEYIEDELGRDDEINLQDYSHQQTRSFRALSLWLSVQVFGLEAFQAAIRHGVRAAQQAEALARASAHLRVVSAAQLGVLTFRYVADGWSGSALDALNKAIVARLQAERYAMVHTTVLKGIKVIRLCLINPRTTPDDIVQTLMHIERIGAEIVAEQAVMSQ